MNEIFIVLEKYLVLTVRLSPEVEIFATYGMGWAAQSTFTSSEMV